MLVPFCSVLDACSDGRVEVYDLLNSAIKGEALRCVDVDTKSFCRAASAKDDAEYLVVADSAAG